MRKGLLFKLIGCAALLFAGPPATAQTRLPSNGSEPGDGPAESKCGPNQTLVGFAGRAGVWVDAIQVVCAPLLAGNVTGGSEPSDHAYGGPGGGAQNVHCPTGSIIENVEVQFTYQQKQVASISLHCRNLGTGRADNLLRFGNPAYDSTKGGGAFIRNDNADFVGIRSNRCPSGELPVGFYGRVGNAVNSIGFICDRVTPIVQQKAVKNERHPDPPPPSPITGHGLARGPAAPAAPAVAPRQAIGGLWQTRTDAGAHYRITIQTITQGIGPTGMELPLQVAGTIVNDDGARQLDGGLQGVIQPNSRTLVFNYSLKNGDGGGGTFTLSQDGKSITGEATSKAKQHFVWNGSRAP